MMVNKNSKTRRMIAAEAARIMATESVHDYQLAKEKALERLHLPLTAAMPGNAEIQLELREYQALFQSDVQTQALQQHRVVAHRIMRRLREFDPHLVGAVLDGTADAHSVVHLHLFADSTKPVVMALLDAGVDFDNHERSVRVSRGRRETVPVLRVREGDTRVELSVFAPSDLHNAPLSHVDGRPMQRANREQVAQLLGT